jgi:hypothetical protein
MSDNLFYWYKEMRDRIKRLENDPEADYHEAQEILNGWKESIKVIEAGNPEIINRYNRHVAIQDSFTPEQIDFICYQIGDWYLNWKTRITTGDGHGHRLGFAKEQLKTMICGD